MKINKNIHNILVIDDNERSNQVVKEFGELTRAMNVFTYVSLKEGLDSFAREKYDLVLLDIKLEDENTLEEIDKVKSIHSGPIIFASGFSDASTINQCLAKGADDYITKPYDLEELFLRIERSIERYGTNRKLIINDYIVDEFEGIVKKGGKEVDLTDVPMRLLIFMLKNYNTVLSREELFVNVWGSEYVFSSRVVDTNVSHIRKKTNDSNIVSVRGKGYMYIR